MAMAVPMPEGIINAAQGLGDAVKNTAVHNAEDATHAVENGAKKVGDVGKDEFEAVKEGTKKVGKMAGNGVNNAAETSDNIINSFQSFLSSLFQPLSNF